MLALWLSGIAQPTRAVKHNEDLQAIHILLKFCNDLNSFLSGNEFMHGTKEVQRNSRALAKEFIRENKEGTNSFKGRGIRSNGLGKRLNFTGSVHKEERILAKEVCNKEGREDD